MTLTRRALRAVTIFSVSMIVLRVIEVSLLLRALLISRSIMDGSAISKAEMATFMELGERVTIVWYAAAIAYLAAIIGFTYVAYNVLRAARVPGLMFGPVSAVLLYAAPLWNVFHPLLTLQELFRASQHDPEKAHLFDWHDEERSLLISVAWILAVGSVLFDLTALYFVRQMPEPDVLVLACGIWSGASIMGIVALLLYRGGLAVITNQIDTMQSSVLSFNQ